MGAETEKTYSSLPVEVKRQPVMVLNEKNFEKVTKSSGYTFVKFYAPWCGHCQMMATDWEEVGEFITKNPIPSVDLSIAEIDCVENALVCMREAVDSYPTIKMYKPDGTVEEYMYARTSARMKRFLIETRLDFDNLPSDSIGIIKLNDYTFEKFLEKNKFVVVKYFIRGCSHCVNLKPTFDDLVIKFLVEENEEVKFAEVECMDLDSLDVCIEQGVEGFPAIHMYKDGQIEDIFSDERTLDNLSNFVWETIDPSRVEDIFDPFTMFAGGFGNLAEGSEDYDYEDEEEECECGEPGCDCGDDFDEAEETEENDYEEDKEVADYDMEEEETVDEDIEGEEATDENGQEEESESVANDNEKEELEEGQNEETDNVDDQETVVNSKEEETIEGVNDAGSLEVSNENAVDEEELIEEKEELSNDEIDTEEINDHLKDEL